ncbi:phage tail sheath C-terminal domain-containing protein [Nucisporomicrobium flavum]|uniref:phage tail sheath C-terminal domain-containing protein n=1 Tax=Nucisporomicrobium flavum TaxID=2785915 RepID=UPI0018F51BFF|nr:phage tail sheath C-terminal domain-containing protein [Nucisporomicrobium flavum]
MPVTPTYPGVYIEESPSAVRTITAVSTSVTAFAGFTPRGPLGEPVTLTSFADYERRFGGLSAGSVLSYSVQQFFLNGGSTAIVVRLVSGGSPAGAPLSGGGGPLLTVSAREPGEFGRGIQVSVDPDAASPDDTFGLRISAPGGGPGETFTGLSLDKDSPRFAEKVVNPSSALVRLDVADDAAGVPAASGTVSDPFADPLPDVTGKKFKVSVQGGGKDWEIDLYDPAHDGSRPARVGELALLLERKLRRVAPGSRALSGARVNAVGQRLQVLAGEPGAVIRFTGPDAGDLKLEGGAVNAPAAPLTGGSDGAAPTAADFIGSQDAKSGIYALLDVDDVNLLCLPEVADLAVDDMIGVLSQAVGLCRDKRMVLIVDPPKGWTSLDAARAGLADIDSVRSSYAALYFPRIRMFDPLAGQLREFPPSGAVAGVLAATDSARGVWKAPAGTDAVLSGVRALSTPLTDPENGLLNPLAVNCLRAFPIIGPVIWGARTLDGADAEGSQWKYLPVRRLALMIEESLYRGTKWVVFEPNDENLWAQIRLNVGAFLRTLFNQGAFQGTSARDAYFVKCDKDTTTQDDINRGVVNILVGFAPLKPAEFVIVKLEQMAGQIEV